MRVFGTVARLLIMAERVNTVHNVCALAFFLSSLGGEHSN